MLLSSTDFGDAERLKEQLSKWLNATLGRTEYAHQIAELEGRHNDLVVPHLVQAAARSIADRGDHRLVAPVERHRPVMKRPLKIGFFGNLANQSFLTVRALRRLGYDAELVVQQDNIDAYPLSRPVWEECEFEIEAIDDPSIAAADYSLPEFVRNVPYNIGEQMHFQGRLDAVPEVIERYRSLTGRKLVLDEALVLAQWMGQWDYLRAMADYDVVHLSMWPICLGLFAPVPTVVCPLGGDLHINSFEQDVQGLMFRASFRGADHIQVCETDYPGYLDRLEAKGPRSFLPLIVDTDTYVVGDEEALRAEWRAQVGGGRYLLGVCRQDWTWKGSDRLIQAFARFRDTGHAEWRLLLQAWGNDLERSRALIKALGLEGCVVWLPMCSKPVLRRRQRAADVVADQFVMEGYGASVFESLAAAKPVIMAPVPSGSEHHFQSGPPPLVGAKTDREIAAAMIRMSDAGERSRVGSASRKWVEEEHGYRVLGSRYHEMFEAARCRWLQSN